MMVRRYRWGELDWVPFFAGVMFSLLCFDRESELDAMWQVWGEGSR